MWSKMLDLIYRWNEQAAWRLCDLSWAADWPGKEVFLQDFRKRLASSAYYGDIERLNFNTGDAKQK